MRITTHIPDPLARDTKIMAENEKKSVSSIIAEALDVLHNRKKEKETGQKGTGDRG